MSQLLRAMLGLSRGGESDENNLELARDKLAIELRRQFALYLDRCKDDINKLENKESFDNLMRNLAGMIGKSSQSTREHP